MICQLCVSKNLLSRVYQGGTSITVMSYLPFYWDEEGNKIINEDPNTHTTKYRCSNNHRWIGERRGKEVTYSWPEDE